MIAIGGRITKKKTVESQSIVLYGYLLSGRAGGGARKRDKILQR